MSIRIDVVNNNQTKKQTDPVTKGAKIGAGIAVAVKAADTFRLHQNLKKETGKGILKNISAEVDNIIETELKEFSGNKKFKALILALAGIGTALYMAFKIGLGAAAGGGLGLLVKGHNDKKEAEQQEITIELLEAEAVKDLD